MEMEEETLTLDEFFTKFPQYEIDRKKIETAFLLAGYSNEKTTDDEQKKLRIALKLAENDSYSDSIVTAFLRNSPNSPDDEIISWNFGNDVLKNVRNSERLSKLNPHSKNLQQADSFRKMIFALADNLQIILLEICFKSDRLRHIESESVENQKAFSQEIIEIWAPIANRFGLSSLKSELEDRTLKILNPDSYSQIETIVKLKVEEQSVFLAKAKEEIYRKAEKAGIEISVTSRVKHFYSIYQKMKKRNKTVEELLDIFAVRIICQTTEECYIIAGLVHSLWKPMDGRFKDYIAMPKDNGYQSLHTTVTCEGIPLEIQIRTNEMHSIAEHGIASHWLYKKGTNKDSVSIENIEIVNKLKEIAGNKDEYGVEEIFSQIKEELLGSSIFVFTPNGEVKELPQGSTAIDFAYAVHTQIGEKISGAKANGAIIPLNKPLENTQVIEVITSQKAHPTQNQLECVKTSRARSRINQWLQKNGMGDSSTVSVKPQVQIPPQIHVQNQAEENKPPVNSDEPLKIKVGETSNYLLSLAQCCNPQRGDPIIGYISRGRGIIIHKKDCNNFLNNPESEQRTIAVEWQTD